MYISSVYTKWLLCCRVHSSSWEKVHASNDWRAAIKQALQGAVSICNSVVLSCLRWKPKGFVHTVYPSNHCSTMHVGVLNLCHQSNVVLVCWQNEWNKLRYFWCKISVCMCSWQLTILYFFDIFRLMTLTVPPIRRTM